MSGTAGGRPVVLLSFDAEEFDIPLEYGHAISPAEQMRIGGEGFERALALLSRVGVVATFFTTAAIAEARTDLVARVVAEGHELASHGRVHGSFEPADLRISREVLERIGSVPVSGFRRARMGRTEASELAAAGYRYDSSENPIWLPGRYNRFFSPRRAYVEPAGEGPTVLRIPTAATPLIRWPLFWLAFKNAPLWVQKLATRWVLAADGAAALYFHPWELCELTAAGGFGLPRHVRRVDGEALEARLEAYLRWLGERADFRTYGQFAEERSAALSAPTAAAR